MLAQLFAVEIPNVYFRYLFQKGNLLSIGFFSVNMYIHIYVCSNATVISVKFHLDIGEMK